MRTHPQTPPPHADALWSHKRKVGQSMGREPSFRWWHGSQRRAHRVVSPPRARAQSQAGPRCAPTGALLALTQLVAWLCSGRGC